MVFPSLIALYVGEHLFLRHPGNDQLIFSHDSEKQPQGNRGRSARTMSPQPPGSPDSGKPGSPLRNRIPVAGLADFRARLDTRQVESELDSIFRESPEFGRNLAHRLSPFLETPESGTLTLIGAGGEVAVFFDAGSQQVVKLCGPPARCRFGWLIHREASGTLTLTPGDLDGVLDRLSLFESLFSSGISIDCIGEEDAFFLNFYKRHDIRFLKIDSVQP